MSKDAAYKSLIDASQIIADNGNLKEGIKDGSLIARLTGAASKRFDKVSDTETALRSLVAKGEIENELNKEDKELKRRTTRAQLALAEKGLAGDNFDATSPFAAESYDAAALMLLAMQSANSLDPAEYKNKVFDVANAPGEKIYPGELGKALDILSSGGEIDYVGASAVELIGNGESVGNYREIEIKNSKVETVRYRQK